MIKSRRQDEIDAAAASWVVRLGGDTLPQTERAALAAWLSADPAHAEALETAQDLWDELTALPRLAVVPAPVVPAHLAARAGRPAVSVSRWLAVAACLLLLIAGGLFWVGNPLIALTADARTSPGEIREVALPDGSVASLGTASAIALHFTDRERRVELLSGEVYFTVAPMQGAETRPFVVAAAGGTAEALGTEFMVARDISGDDEGATVAVAEHTVRVAVNADAAGTDMGSVVLKPGEAVHYDRETGLGSVAALDLGEATAWRRRHLIFDRVPLTDVIAELNRYRRGRIIVENAALAGRSVSGVFDIDDLDGALATIARELQARTVAVPPFVTVLY